MANANKIIAEMLAILNDKVDIKLINIEGGNADNAIPTEARCTCPILDDNKLLGIWKGSSLDSEVKVIIVR